MLAGVIAVLRDVRCEGLVTAVEGFVGDFLAAGSFFVTIFVSGFFGLKIPAPPPTSAPTSWADALRADSDKLRHRDAANIKTARTIA
jgi:hypothetical protein